MKRFVFLMLITLSMFHSAPIKTYFMTTNANWDGDLNFIIDMINLNSDLNKIELQDILCKKSLDYKQENKFRKNMNTMFMYFYLPGGIKTNTVKIKNNQCISI